SVVQLLGARARISVHRLRRPAPGLGRPRDRLVGAAAGIRRAVQDRNNPSSQMAEDPNGADGSLSRQAPGYSPSMNGYACSRGGLKFSFSVRALTQRTRFSFDPALSFVPEPRAPPNGCWPTT